MPPGGQWADLAQAAPQGLAAVVHPLHTFKCLRKGRAGRRTGNQAERKGSNAKGKKPTIHKGTGRAKQPVMFGPNFDSAPG